MKLLRLCILILLMAAWPASQARDLRLEGARLLQTDLSASVYSRADLAGNACALVKVAFPQAGAEFEGSVIGTVDYKAGEYWVYVTAGSKYLKMKHADYTPLMISFDGDPVGPLEAKKVYGVKVGGGAQAQTVTFKITPPDAILTVDLKEYPTVNGMAKIQLSPGEHSYMVVAPGYESYGSRFVVDEDRDNKLFVELERKAGVPGTTQPDSQESAGGAAVETFNVNGVTFEMVRVDGGSFMMGSDDGWNNETPVHNENVSTFYIGKTEVTQQLWEAVMRSNPSKFPGPNLAVENVSWDDCQEFVERLSRLTGRNFRLPTEAEWEFAARGGKRSRGYKYSGSNDIDRVAWYEENSGMRTHPVGQKLDNELGIFDMSGNVWEWCADNYSSSYSQPRNSSDRVLRGGSWDYAAASCRVANRNCLAPGDRNYNLGLRLAL